jgi:hypothetical protein
MCKKFNFWRLNLIKNFVWPAMGLELYTLDLYQKVSETHGPPNVILRPHLT